MADNTEIQRRRTFAIIAHPDAGKTSLTEKLLLFGGQIQVAGAVKSNKIKKTATSDWMEIEKQRGISVTTSVMEFDCQGALRLQFRGISVSMGLKPHAFTQKEASYGPDLLS